VALQVHQVQVVQVEQAEVQVHLELQVHQVQVEQVVLKEVDYLL
jgi:hypothetical protein